MKKNANLAIIWVVILGVFASISYLNAEIKNEDRASKGEWDFCLQKLWEVNCADDYVITQISDIQVDDDGKIYILEWKHYKFFVFNDRGKFLYSFGKKGEGPGEYKNAFYFFLEGEYVIVPDQGRVHYFRKDGKYVKSYICGSVGAPRIFLDEYRFIMLQEYEKKNNMEKLEIFDLKNRKRKTIAEIGAEKELKAAGGGMLVKFQDVNTTPMFIFSKHNNELYFGRNNRYFIKKVDINGNELLSFSISGRKPKKIPVHFKRKRFESVRINNKRMPKEMIDQMVKSMPDYCTLFNQIVIDKTGLIYIYVNDAANETGQEIDIFSPEGKYLYRSKIALPEGLKKVTPFIIKGNSLLVFAEDNRGEQKLIKFKIEKPTN